MSETMEPEDKIKKEVEKLKLMKLEIMSSDNDDELPKFN